MTASFEPSQEQRRLARAMAGLGLPEEQIALLLEVDPKTLRKHFRDDLDRGMAEANVKIAQSLFNMATTGNNVAAAIFWMKARAGWREKHDITVSTGPLREIPDDELERMLTVLQDAIAEQTAIGTTPHAGADTAPGAVVTAIGRRPTLIEAD